jgi:RimJ/RimL family protein N-acetyltransferase
MKPIQLIAYNKNEIDSIRKSIDSEMKQMIWAGPKYIFPITNNQIEERIIKGVDVFSVYSEKEQKIIGFIELEKIENENIGSIQSVLIYSEYRGKKYSNNLINEIIQYGFENKGYNELRLKVFSTNEIAKKCYESNRFKVFNEIVRKGNDDSIQFKLYEMKLGKD